MARASGRVPDDIQAEEFADLGMFLDMDLSILGASFQDFDVYEAGVRKEYHEIPEVQFKQGRAAILERFLERDYLYFQLGAGVGLSKRREIICGVQLRC